MAPMPSLPCLACRGRSRSPVFATQFDELPELTEGGRPGCRRYAHFVTDVPLEAARNRQGDMWRSRAVLPGRIEDAEAAATARRDRSQGRLPPCVSCVRMSVNSRSDRATSVDYRSQVSGCPFIEWGPCT